MKPEPRRAPGGLAASLRHLPAAVAALVLGAPLLASAGLVYTVDRHVGAATVSGTIETDGAIGALHTSNLLSWSLIVDDSSGPLGFASGLNSEAYVLGNAFTATDQGLFFDFSAVGAVLQFQNPGIGRGGRWWCVESQDGWCLGVDGGESVGPAYQYGELTTHQGLVQLGARVVNAVPEPGSLLLALAGVGLLAGTARRRAPRAEG